MKFSSLQLILFACWAASAAAVEPSKSSVTLDALVAQALTENPELKFYEAEIAAAKGERRSAGTWANPQFSSEVGRKQVRGDVAAEGSAWAVSVSQTFEWPGRVSLRKAIADRQVQLASAGLEQFRAALAAQVRQKGFALLAAQQRAAAAQEVAVRGEELVAILVQREPAGVAPLLETRAIEGAVIKLKRGASKAQQEAQTALFALNTLRGRPVADLVTVAMPSLAFPELPSIEVLVRRIARANFELKQREIELAQQGFRLQLSENEAWPSITIGPQVTQERAGDKETIAGFGVSLPLPLWNRNGGGVDTAKARLLQAETSLRVKQRELEQRARTHAAAYELHRKEMARWNPKIVEQLREALVLADRHYRLGAVPLSTYLDVQNQSLEALDAIFATQADALEALAELELLTSSNLHSK